MIKDVLLADQPTKRFVTVEEIAALVVHLCQVILLTMRCRGMLLAESAESMLGCLELAELRTVRPALSYVQGPQHGQRP